MATTTNYGWSTPDDTALVSQGAAAIRTLGSSADTTVKALSPGTTAGDVDYYTSSTAKARLGIGTSGQVLTVAAGVPSWASPSGGSMTSLATGSLSGVEVSLTSISQAYKTLYLWIQNARVSSGTYMGIRVNNITGATYNTMNMQTNNGTLVNNVGLTVLNITSGINLDTSSTTFQQTIKIDNYTSATVSKAVNFSCAHNESNLGVGWANTTAAVTSLQIRTGNGTSTFSAGTYILYGVN